MKLSQNKNSSDTSKIRVTQGTYQAKLLRQLISRIFIALIGLVVIYLMIASMLIRFMPTSAGFMLVKNPTYAGGLIPLNAQVLVDTTATEPVPDGVVANLKRAIVPSNNLSLVQVLTPSTGRLKWAGGVLSVDGQPLSVPVFTDPGKAFLDNEYVAVCLKGKCDPGTAIIFNSLQLVAVPVKQDSVIPTAVTPPAQLQIDRSTSSNVAGTFIAAGYNHDVDVACSLTSEAYRNSFGNPDGCKIFAESFSSNLGDNDPAKMSLTNKVTGPNTVVESYSIPRIDETPLTGSFSLKKTTDGWTIVGHTRA